MAQKAQLFDDLGRAAGHPIPRVTDAIDLGHESSLPIFLYGDAEVPRPVREKAARKSFVASKSMTAAVSAMLAVAAIVAVMLFRDSFTASSDSKPALADTSVEARPLMDETTIGTAGARITPSRDEIAAAFNEARRNQSENRQPTEPALPETATARAEKTGPATVSNPDEVAAMINRAKRLLVIGDIAPARLLLQRAAAAREPSAALLLAQTFDPAVLGSSDPRRIKPDPAIARYWYEKAAEFGSSDASQRLAQMND